MGDEGLHDLNALRRQIDEMDEQFIACLARRLELSEKIAAQKRTTSSPVLQPARAAEVEENYMAFGQQFGLDPQFMKSLFEVIHDESCRLQRRAIE